MNELAKILKENAEEGRWITTKYGGRVFIGNKNPDYFHPKFSDIRRQEGKFAEAKARLEDDDESIRLSAALDLNGVTDLPKEQIKILAESSITDANEKVRASSLRALKTVGDEKSVKPILAAIAKNKISDNEIDNYLTVALQVRNQGKEVKISFD